MGAVFKREFKSYFTNMTGYIVIGVLLLFCGIFTTAVNLMGGYASFEYALSNMMIVLLILVPVLAMKSMADDRRTRTDQLLYSLPISTAQVVIGKYLSLVAVYGLACLGMAFVPIILSFYGSVPFASSYTALFGFFLLGCALIAVCMFFSGLTESQIIAAVLGLAATLSFYLMNALSSLLPDTVTGSFVCFLVLIAAIGLLLYFLTKNYLVAIGAAVVLTVPLVLVRILSADTLEGLFPRLLKALAVFDRYEKMTGGIFDLTSVVYFISVAVFFVFLSVQSMEKRRWS